jgi:hypothetical protein
MFMPASSIASTALLLNRRAEHILSLKYYITCAGFIHPSKKCSPQKAPPPSVFIKVKEGGGSQNVWVVSGHKHLFSADKNCSIIEFRKHLYIPCKVHLIFPASLIPQKSMAGKQEGPKDYLFEYIWKIIRQKGADYENCCIRRLHGKSGRSELGRTG